MTATARRLLPLCLAPLLALAACGDTIQGADGGATCDCLGPKGKLEFGWPPDARCVTPLRKGTAPDFLLVNTCVASSIGTNTKPYSLVGATFSSTNDKLVLGGYDGTCGDNCLALRWKDATGTADLVVSRNGAEVDRVTLTLTP